MLGGSFNPAHAGHRHISLLALHGLDLDQIWWLVSPQNPLKAQAEMAPLADRLAVARAVARHPRIWPTDLEARLGTRYTIDTLGALRQRYPQHRLVWLMGADNLIQMTRWKRWPAIFRTVPVAIFDRPNYHYRALAGCAARRFGRFRVGREGLTGLADRMPPAWAFVACPPHPASATAIRARRARRGDMQRSDEHR